MKTCPYCGEKYPDDATVCAIDGRELPDLDSVVVADRKNVTGVWRGAYGHGKSEQLEGMRPIVFTLRLNQGRSEQFTGSITQDDPNGTPATGTVGGYLKWPSIEFTKQMPVGYVTGPDGTLMTLREYFLANGHRCEHEPPSELMLYQGTFLDANRVQGTWTIFPQQIQLPDGKSFTISGTPGFWCAEFVTDDLHADPTRGPTEALFDKTLLSPAELEDVEGVPFRSIGKFSVGDTEKFVDRFWQNAIRFQLNGDDDAMSQLLPDTEVAGEDTGSPKLIEIFVHPDDEEKAAEITGGGNQI